MYLKAVERGYGEYTIYDTAYTAPYITSLVINALNEHTHTYRRAGEQKARFQEAWNKILIRFCIQQIV